MKVAILSPENPSSPLILAENLHHRLKKRGVESKLFFCHGLLHRLCPRSKSGKKAHFHWRQKVQRWKDDSARIRELATFDAIVLADYIPTAYNPGRYGVEPLRVKTGTPVYIYEVYSPHNAPSIEARIQDQYGVDPQAHFDGILHVASTTEVQGTPYPTSFCIGLTSEVWQLQSLSKSEMHVVVDFVQPGHEVNRERQIKTLESLGIAFTSLEGKYAVKDIRKIYSQATHYIIQSSEAFGLPICECLNCGAEILTQEAHWPMSWRKGDAIRSFEEGTLPEYFHVFRDQAGLQQCLEQAQYVNLTARAQEVQNQFREDYPQFYHGDDDELSRWLNTLTA